jgi:GNAT superfamily N-acetyltransferase
LQEQPCEWRRGEHVVSSEHERLDRVLVHRFLSEQSYWASGVSASQVERSLRNSFCFGLYRTSEQVGFARVVSDAARFAFLADVFVLEHARGQGLGKWLVECALDHPALRDVERWVLGTRDAHGLYERFGFHMYPEGRLMRRLVPRR